MGSGTLRLCQNIFQLNIYWYQNKKKLAPKVKPFKKVILGVHMGGGGTPQNYVKILFCSISTDIKKTGTLGQAVQKRDFWGPIWGFSGEDNTPKLCQNIYLLSIR